MGARARGAALIAAGVLLRAAIATADEETAPELGRLGTTPLYDQLRDAEQRIGPLKEQVGLFEFHDYLRTGYGLNSRGGQQVAFQTPGAAAKYRLGNV